MFESPDSSTLREMPTMELEPPSRSGRLPGAPIEVARAANLLDKRARVGTRNRQPGKNENEKRAFVQGSGLALDFFHYPAATMNFPPLPNLLRWMAI